MLQTWHNELEILYPQLVKWRRHLHQNPELSFQEVKTPAMIAQILESLGIEVRKGVGGRGVVGVIRGGRPGKTIALRADFDALPINDLKDVPYKSQVPGVMHACGHDGHTATLLGVASVLNQNRSNLAGNVVLLHQHAEEQTPGGAVSMIEDGCLEGVDVVFGTHLTTSAPTGTYLYKEGLIMAASDQFNLTVQGKGGHSSTPHETIDAITVTTQIIHHWQYIISRKVDPQKPSVLSVGSFHAGLAPNVIADTAEISGSVRTYDADVRDQIEREIRKAVQAICDDAGASYTLDYKRGYPSVNNHPKETKVFVQAMEKAGFTDRLSEMTPLMGGEDFAYYLEQVPGTFFFTGARNEVIGADMPHHHPMFDFDETAMLDAGKAFLTLIHHYAIETAEQKAAEPIG